MEVTIPPDMLARAYAEAEQHGVTVAEWWTQATAVAEAYAAQVAEAQAACAEVMAEIGPPDPTEAGEAAAALERSAARLAARHASSAHSIPAA